VYFKIFNAQYDSWKKIPFGKKSNFVNFCSNEIMDITNPSALLRKKKALTNLFNAHVAVVVVKKWWLLIADLFYLTVL